MARRLGGTLAVVVAAYALAGAVPLANAATTVSTYIDGRYGDYGITVIAGSARNDIAVGFNDADRTFLIADTQPIVIDDDYPALAPECVSVTPRQVRCASPADTAFTVEAGDGADRVGIARSVVLSTALYGGHGDDRLVGGTGPDSITGEKGNDVERGRLGQDSLGARGGAGDRGRDKFFGGNGPDLLEAIDGRRDKRVRCGQGEDEAAVDSRDPRPIRCEEVEELTSKRGVAPAL